MNNRIVPGTSTVELSVKDTYGCKKTYYFSVTVTNTKPVFTTTLTPIPDIVMAINDVKTFNTDYFTDKEGSDVILSCLRTVVSAGSFPTTFITPTIMGTKASN